MSQKLTFYSIGENCLGHGVLERHGKVVAATPFSHGRSNIDYLMQMVRTKFDGFMDESQLRYDDRHNTRIVINPRYTCDSELFDPTVANSFEFTHHDVLAKPQAKASYERKVRRFQDAIKGEGNACFLYHYRSHPKQDFARLTEKLRQFRDLMRQEATRPITVAMFTQRKIANDDMRGVEFRRVNDIPVAVLRTRQIWGGRDMDVFWGRSDDDLFAPMIGAFEFDAVTNTMPQTADTPPRLLARIWPRRR